MSESLANVRYSLRSQDIETLERFGLNTIPASTPTGYILLVNDKGVRTPYEFALDKGDRVIYVQRIRSNNTLDPLKLAVSITEETRLGNVLKLRNASRKEGKAPFRPYGTLAAVVTWEIPRGGERRPLAEVMKVLDQAISVGPQLTVEEHDEGLEHIRPQETAPPKAAPQAAGPKQSSDEPVEITPGVWEYTHLTESILAKGGYFYLTKAGLVFRYTFDSSTTLATLEKIFASDSVPRNIKYLTKHPSTTETSPAQGRGQKWRGTVGPFDHIIRSDEGLSAKKVRAILKLAGPHQTQPR